MVTGTCLYAGSVTCWLGCTAVSTTAAIVMMVNLTLLEQDDENNIIVLLQNISVETFQLEEDRTHGL